jgi:hypothetical protein
MSATLREIKINSLKRTYALFKQAEENGTLKTVPLTEEQKQILRPAQA